MRQLEQDGTAPAGDHDHFAVDLPGNAFGPDPYVIRLEQARAYSRAMAFERICARSHFHSIDLVMGRRGRRPSSIGSAIDDMTRTSFARHDRDPFGRAHRRPST
jgi:hypothetical protein